MEEQKEYEPNNYPPLNESKLIKEQKTDWLKITVAIFLGMMLGAIGFGLIVQTEMTEQFIPDHICNQQLDESFINGSITGFNQGRLSGAIEVSLGVLINDTMPEFYPINETTVGFDIINMTEYYLNKQKIK